MKGFDLRTDCLGSLDLIQAEAEWVGWAVIGSDTLPSSSPSIWLEGIRFGLGCVSLEPLSIKPQ